MGADLITLDEYKITEGINSTKYDDKLDEIITSVSQLVKTYCGTDFVDNTGSPGYTETFDIQWDTHVVQLRKAPVIDILGVYERVSQSDSYTELFRDGGGSPAEYSWYLDTITDSILRTNPSGSYKCWPKGVGAVQVVYTSGYATLPADLKMGVVDLVTYYHNNEYRDRQAIGATSRESVSTSTITNDPGFPDHIRRVLDLYKGL